MSLITISQNIGSKGRLIARKVAEGLKVELFDDARLRQVALDQGIPAHELGSLDEKAPGFFDSFLNRRPPFYLEHLETVVYKVAGLGQGVIVGHGSQVLLRDFGCAFHVRIHASREERIVSLMNEQELTRSVTEKMVTKFDQEQKAFLQYAFQLNEEDLSLYDLIVNTGKISVDTAAAIIMNTTRSEDIRACGLEVLDSIEHLSLKRQIQAALLKNDIDVQTLHIEMPEKGVVNISGLCRTNEQKDRIAKTVQAIKGITRVQTELKVYAAVV
jgi:cytidylate kinase